MRFLKLESDNDDHCNFSPSSIFMPSNLTRGCMLIYILSSFKVNFISITKNLNTKINNIFWLFSKFNKNIICCLYKCSLKTAWTKRCNLVTLRYKVLICISHFFVLADKKKTTEEKKWKTTTMLLKVVIYQVSLDWTNLKFILKTMYMFFTGTSQWKYIMKYVFFSSDKQHKSIW